MPEYRNLLALYDCRSKQEYIYRTNRVKEITGASLLLTDLFKEFFDKTEEFDICTEWKKQTAPENFLEYFNQSGKDAEIIYEGGGNLCMIYKDEETYIRVNRALSKHVIKKTFSVSIIASAVPVTGDFLEDRKNLYQQNAIRKNTGAYFVPCNVLPFTQVDRLTYQPIVKKREDKQYTSESWAKLKKYENKYGKEKVTMFDEMTDKGNDSILAIIYIDGNNMGKKVKNITEGKHDYSEGINALREFSKKTHADFVENPITAIKEKLDELCQACGNDTEKQRQYQFRQIIAGGDEITIVCSARAVVEILNTYFETLTSVKAEKDEDKNSACAGVALFHSHAPFADVYRIAEACCESGKELSHLEGNEDKNYIDFHFCHAGIMNDMETIRKQQEGDFTARPYEFSESWQKFLEYGRILSQTKRSNVKDLGEAIAKGERFYDENGKIIKAGDSYYREELERIKSRDSRDKKNLCEAIYSNPEDEEKKKMIFDISVIFDLWFSGKEMKHEQT